MQFIQGPIYQNDTKLIDEFFYNNLNKFSKVLKLKQIILSLAVRL